MSDNTPLSPADYALAQQRQAHAERTAASAPGVPRPAAARPSGKREPPAPYVPFPVGLLPEPARSFVTETSRAIGCDRAYVALPLLAALGAAVGNSRAVILKRGWVEPPILWCAIVGESGTLKTPAFKAALKPIRAVQARWFAEYEARLAAWRLAEARREVELKAWQSAAVAAHRKNANAGDPPEAVPEPVCRRCVVSDTTVEALAPILMKNPRGVLLARDELAGWMGSFDRYAKGGRGGADVAHWLSMHCGEALIVDRKTGADRTIFIPRAAVSVVGGIQPGTLRRAIGVEHEENGLLARLLFAMPPRRMKRWTEAVVPEAVEEQMQIIFGAMFQLTPDADADGNEQPRLIALDSDARAAWREFYNEHALEELEFDGAAASAWSKLEGYAARFALVVHLTRAAAGDPTLLNPNRIDAASVAAGVGLSRWFGSEARRVYAVLGESEGDAAVRRLVEWIRRRGVAVSARDLMRSGPCCKRAEDAEALLNGLAAAGYGEWVVDNHGGGRGQPARLFRLFDPPDTDTNTELQAEKAIVSVVSESVNPRCDLPGCPDDGELPGAPDDGDLGAFCSDLPEGVES